MTLQHFTSEVLILHLMYLIYILCAYFIYNVLILYLMCLFYTWCAYFEEVHLFFSLSWAKWMFISQSIFIIILHVSSLIVIVLTIQLYILRLSLTILIRVVLIFQPATSITIHVVQRKYISLSINSEADASELTKNMLKNVSLVMWQWL